MAYAKNTTVPPGKTRDQIIDLLRKHGARDFELWENEKKARISFSFNTHRISVTIPVTGNRQQVATRWRVFHLAIKAKLELIASGGSTFEHEFFADIALPSGQTISEAIDHVVLEGGVEDMVDAYEAVESGDEGAVVDAEFAIIDAE